MRYLILAAAAATVSASLPAYAGTNGTTTSSEATTPNPNAAPWDLKGKDVSAARTASAQLRGDLQQAGFTDIHIMPQSFLVRAKNKEGMQVMMVVNPDSITAVTAMTDTTGGSAGNAGASAGTKDQQNTAEGSAKMQGTNEPNHVNPSDTTSGTAANTAGTSTTKTE